MITSSRGIRFVWFVGFILLIGSLVGAGWVLNQPASGTVAKTPNDQAGAGVVGLGHADIEEGLTYLHPTQQGTVESVWVQEGAVVKKGDLLLTIDNRIQKLTLDRASADLAMAQRDLIDAELFVKDHQHQIGIEQEKILAAGSKIEAAKSTRDIQKKAKELGQLTYADEQIAVAENELKAAEHNLEALKKGLARLKDVDPYSKVEMARRQIDVKTAQRDQAHIAYLECDLYAPADGTILRLFANVGQPLSSQSRQLAVYFCPKAPVIIRAYMLQEWANKLKEDQPAFIEDDTRHGIQWKGRVERVGKMFTQRREKLLEPFQYNDVRMLEFIVYLDQGGPPIRIGQSVRVTVK